MTDERGGVRYVSSEAFSDLYKETTTARRLEGPESIPTPEGSVLARTGMWVVTSDRQESWPVTEEWFAVGYEQSPHQPAAQSDPTVTSTSSDQPPDDTLPAAPGVKRDNPAYQEEAENGNLSLRSSSTKVCDRYR